MIGPILAQSLVETLVQSCDLQFFPILNILDQHWFIVGTPLVQCCATLVHCWYTIGSMLCNLSLMLVKYWFKVGTLLKQSLVATLVQSCDLQFFPILNTLDQHWLIVGTPLAQCCTTLV